MYVCTCVINGELSFSLKSDFKQRFCVFDLISSLSLAIFLLNVSNVREFRKVRKLKYSYWISCFKRIFYQLLPCRRQYQNKNNLYFWFSTSSSMLLYATSVNRVRRKSTGIIKKAVFRCDSRKQYVQKVGDRMLIISQFRKKFP